MKKIFFFGFLIFFLTFSMCAEKFTEAGFHISFSPVYSFELGQLDEFVFSKDSMENEYKLSELNWDLQNHYLGISADFGWKWISIGTNASLGFSGNSGNMLDSDWQDNSNHSIKTNFSISDNSIKSSGSFEIRLKGILPVTPESKADIFAIKVIPSVTYHYSYHSFSANNAEGWYGDSGHTGKTSVPYDSEYAKHYEKGTLCGIDYLREQNKVFIGTGVDFNFIKRFNLFLNFDISVYSSINSLDTHYGNLNKTTGKMFLDKMQEAFKTIRFSASLNYNFYKDFYICADYLFTHQELAQGISYAKYSLTDTSYKLDETVTSGSVASTHRFSIYVKIALGNQYFLY